MGIAADRARYSSTPQSNVSSTPKSNVTYKIVDGKFVKQEPTETPTQKNGSTSLIEGTDTLTVIDKNTGKIIRPGTYSGGSGLPSVTGGGQISQITQEDIEKIKNQPTPLTQKQEKTLQSQLSKTTQQVSFDPRFGFDSQRLKEAEKYLTIPQEKRTPQMQEAINYAYTTTPAQKTFELQQAMREELRKQPNPFIQQKTPSTGSLRTQKGNVLERIFKTSEEAEQNILSGKISGGLQKEGQILQNIGEEIYQQKPKIPFFSNKSKIAKMYERANLLTSPKENLSSFLPFLTFPSKLGGSILMGAGQTVETAGNIIEAASKRETYEGIGSAAIGAGKYLIDVGRTADISFYEKDLKGHKIKLPIPIITPSEKVKQDIEKTTVLIGDIATGVTKEFITAPIKSTGELIGSGIVIGGATSLENKFIGFGKAGISILKGGKYIPAKQLYEINPKNLIKGKYKKGTPKSTIKEFTKGKNPKQLFHSTETDFLKKGKAKVETLKPLPATDPKGLFASSGKANEAYLRLSGQIYNLKPRIPFVNMPTPAKPTTYRLIGTTKPQRLTKLGKLKNLKQAKKLFETAKTSKNIPYTSPANELRKKMENEVLLREGTILTTKGIKGTHDFTFVKGTFVKTPRVRVMPSKPTKLLKKPKIPVKEKISKVIKPKKEVSFSRSLEQSRAPGTFYNPAPLIRASLSRTKNINVSRIISRPSRTVSRPSLSISRIISRPSPSSSRITSRPSLLTSSSVSRTSIPSSSMLSSTSSNPSSSSSSSLSRPRPSTSTSTGSGTRSSTMPPPSRIKPSTSSKNNRTQNPSYNVYVRKTLPGTKKVAPQLVARDLPINKGINEGTRIASRYTQRTVQLKRTGYTSMSDESLNRQRLQQYRGFSPKSKIQRQTINLVEKSKFAIDSYEEKQGIPYKGQQVRKKQAFIKKLRLI